MLIVIMMAMAMLMMLMLMFKNVYDVKDYGYNENNDSYNNDPESKGDKDDNDVNNTDNNDDQKINAQITLHIYMNGFQIFTLDSELTFFGSHQY